MGTLDGKVAVVTGGASGIGRATAERLAREGARVVIADLDGEGAEKAADAIREAGAKASGVRTDVTSADDTEEMVRVAEENFGGLHVLFANAGIGTPPVSTEETGEEVWDRTMAVNAKGVFLCCRAAIPALRRNGGGSIVINASIVAVRARPGYPAYAASKAAVVQLGRVISLEGAADNIRVNCVAPVAADTSMLDTLVGDKDPEAAREAIMATIPMGRLTSTEDVAAVATFLASDDAEFVTGTVIPVDGGRGI
ncbi:MAG: SDR family NAD(P)-dependent oxidoreductase [Rubrobacteraceae bacterium]